MIMASDVILQKSSIRVNQLMLINKTQISITQRGWSALVLGFQSCCCPPMSVTPGSGCQSGTAVLISVNDPPCI